MNGLSVPCSETSPSLAALVARVDPTLPEYREKTSPEGMLTIVFTDIEGSTEMMERLGEDRWIEVISAHNRLVRGCVRDHGGDVVSSQGDGFMIVFASASAALDCAVACQRIFSLYNAERPAQSLRVRVGMHTGNIFQADEGFLGKAVVLAARITGRARGGEIFVSAACREYTYRIGRWRYGAPLELRLKGLVGAERVYPLEWSLD